MSSLDQILLQTILLLQFCISLKNLKLCKNLGSKLTQSYIQIKISLLTISKRWTTSNASCSKHQECILLQVDYSQELLLRTSICSEFPFQKEVLFQQIGQLHFLILKYLRIHMSSIQRGGRKRSAKNILRWWHLHSAVVQEDA